MKFLLVQILVVVANIQVRILKVEVGKGFMRTAFDHELVDPKVQIDLIEKRKNKIFSSNRKGKRLIFLYQRVDNLNGNVIEISDIVT